MAICHDIAEVRIGDITPHDGVPAEEKVRIETEAMLDLAGWARKVNACLNLSRIRGRRNRRSEISQTL